MKTIIVATMEKHPSLVLEITHGADVDPVKAVKAAAQEFLATSEGEEYLQQMVAPDRFNWGDMVAVVPDEILARHGVSLFGLVEPVVLVDHDECLAEAPASEG